MLPVTLGKGSQELEKDSNQGGGQRGVGDRWGGKGRKPA